MLRVRVRVRVRVRDTRRCTREYHGLCARGMSQGRARARARGRHTEVHVRDARRHARFAEHRRRAPARWRNAPRSCCCHRLWQSQTVTEVSGGGSARPLVHPVAETDSDRGVSRRYDLTRLQSAQVDGGGRGGGGGKELRLPDIVLVKKIAAPRQHRRRLWKLRSLIKEEEEGTYLSIHRHESAGGCMYVCMHTHAYVLACRKDTHTHTHTHTWDNSVALVYCCR